MTTRPNILLKVLNENISSGNKKYIETAQMKCLKIKNDNPE